MVCRWTQSQNVGFVTRRLISEWQSLFWRWIWIYNTKWHMFHTFHAEIWTLLSSPFFILSACNILDKCMYLQVVWKNSVYSGHMASLEASWFESTLFFFFSKAIHLDPAEQGLTVFALNARLMGLQAVFSFLYVIIRSQFRTATQRNFPGWRHVGFDIGFWWLHVGQVRS